MAHTVSILIPIRNEERYLDLVLQGLLEQDYPLQLLEVILVDGLSTDTTPMLLKEYAASVQSFRIVLLTNEDRHVSTSLNIGLRHSTGEIVIRMDAHTEYAHDYVRQCVTTLLETGADNVGGPVRTKADGCVQQAVAAAFHSPFSVGGAAFHNTAASGWVDTVPYGCWWRSQLIELGGFDESLIRNQDDELNLRITRAGGRIWLNPDIVSWYHPRSSLRALFTQYLQYGYWKVEVIRKHKLPASVRHVVPILLVLSILAVPVTFVADSMIFTVNVLGLVLYAALILLFSILTAIRTRLLLLPMLVIIFPTFHLSYGVGFLAGILKHAFPQSLSTLMSRHSVFSGLTR